MAQATAAGLQRARPHNAGQPSPYSIMYPPVRPHHSRRSSGKLRPSNPMWQTMTAKKKVMTKVGPTVSRNHGPKRLNPFENIISSRKDSPNATPPLTTAQRTRPNHFLN